MEGRADCELRIWSVASFVRLSYALIPVSIDQDARQTRIPLDLCQQSGLAKLDAKQNTIAPVVNAVAITEYVPTATWFALVGHSPAQDTSAL